MSKVKQEAAYTYRVKTPPDVTQANTWQVNKYLYTEYADGGFSVVMKPISQFESKKEAKKHAMNLAITDLIINRENVDGESNLVLPEDRLTDADWTRIISYAPRSITEHMLICIQTKPEIDEDEDE